MNCWLKLVNLWMEQKFPKVMLLLNLIEENQQLIVAVSNISKKNLVKINQNLMNGLKLDLIYMDGESFQCKNEETLFFLKKKIPISCLGLNGNEENLNIMVYFIKKTVKKRSR